MGTFLGSVSNSIKLIEDATEGDSAIHIACNTLIGDQDNNYWTNYGDCLSSSTQVDEYSYWNIYASDLSIDSYHKETVDTSSRVRASLIF